VLSLLAFTLAQWQVWSKPQGEWPDWQKVLLELKRQLVPELMLDELQVALALLQPYLLVEKAAGS
jgi:hypothetical protein